MAGKRPENTEVFVYQNVNSYRRINDDCVYRSIALALDISWEQVLRELVEISLRTGYAPNTKQCYGRYLLEKKYWQLLDNSIKQGAAENLYNNHVKKL